MIALFSNRYHAMNRYFYLRELYIMCGMGIHVFYESQEAHCEHPPFWWVHPSVGGGAFVSCNFYSIIHFFEK